MSNDLQATNLSPFNIHTEREGMEDEAHENAPVRSPKSPSLNNNNNSSGSNSNNNNNNGINKEQDRFLPIANVGRIMKKVIPANGKISKDAKETVQECVSEFISFVTGEASEKCQREKRKTINGDDIIWALATLNFEDYVNPLKLYLNKYKEVEGEKLNNPKQQQQPQQSQRPRSLATDQQLQQRMHHHHHFLQQPDQMALLGPNAGGFGPFSSPASVYSSPSPLAQQSPFVGADQSFTLPSFSPSNSLQKTYNQHSEQIDSLAHW